MSDINDIQQLRNIITNKLDIFENGRDLVKAKQIIFENGINIVLYECRKHNRAMDFHSFCEVMRHKKIFN